MCVLVHDVTFLCSDQRSKPHTPLAITNYYIVIIMAIFYFIFFVERNTVVEFF